MERPNNKEVVLRKAIAVTKSCTTFEQLRYSLKYSILFYKQFRDDKLYAELMRANIFQRREIDRNQSIGSYI